MNLLDDTNQDDQVQIDPNKNYLEELVGEGKKFKTIEDLARGKAEADLYIEDFKRRQDELRQDYTRLKSEYDAGPSLKELIDQMKANKESNVDSNQSNEDKSDTLDLTKVEQMVQAQLAAAKQRDREEANFNQVQAKLLEAYGPNYAQHLKSQVNQLGLTTDFVNDLAKKHPQVLYKTLGLDAQKRDDNFQAPPRNTVKSDPFTPAVNKRTWSYYEKMRKEKPTEYFDPKTQDQMFKDATALGSAFEDSNFEKRFI